MKDVGTNIFLPLMSLQVVLSSPIYFVLGWGTFLCYIYDGLLLDLKRRYSPFSQVVEYCSFVSFVLSVYSFVSVVVYCLFLCFVYVEDFNWSHRIHEGSSR